MSEAIEEYSKFSIGYAVAALGFSVLQFGDLLEAPAKFAALLCFACFGFSSLFGFLVISSYAASHKDGDDAAKQAARQRRVNKYGGWHSFCFILGLLPLMVLIVADLLTALPRELPEVKIQCLEAFMKGWPICN